MRDKMRCGIRHIKYGIAFKLGLLLASFGLVAMGIVGYTSYVSSRATILNVAQRDLLTATQVLGRSFQATIDEISADTLLLTRLPLSPAIAAADAGSENHAAIERDKKLLADTFSAMLEVHPDYVQIRLIGVNQHGLELVRVDRDRDQLVRIAADDLQEKAHYPYVFNTLKLARGQIYLSDIGLNHEQGAHSGLDKPTVRVATPVVSGGGKVLGLIVINLDLNRLFAHLKTDLPSAYQLYLSNHWGDYLIHPNAAETFGFDQGRRVFIQDAFTPVAALINGNSASVVTQIEGAQQPNDGLVAAFVRLPFGGSIEKHFVILGLSQPLENVVRETKNLGWKTLQMILLLGALAALLAALVSRAVTGPLSTMADAMKLFSKKHLFSPLPLARKDEIGMLARSLNDMQAIIVANMQELNESRQALKHLAQHDTLTGLPNRALFDDRLGQAVAQAQRDQCRMALLFIDLDAFKMVNDTYGHHIGDLLLKAAAVRMEACVRHADTVGRLGGDEFVVLLPYVDVPQDALLVAEKICQGLNLPFDLDKLSLHISSSIGIAVYPEDGSDALALSRSADAAMYLAKVNGGNRARLSSPG
ncbi:MAG: diguanylate cyclase [Undibacterium sp.]|uniref:putative bifunctional diguanylate cyclase/phosphodiesterase n=1 Tax=Undibacterium sp. TaxID=1914977 RepID=UPI00272690DE|nr:diguanylate cyclase [Undibacterium sp.]MDO8650813.1 diguanylate cyclase [Undibacterium sp.]